MKASAGKRVLMLLENGTYPKDGRVRREAGTLTAAGFDVTVIAPGDREQPKRETINGVRVYRYRGPAGGNGLLGYAWEYGYSMAAAFALSLVVFFRHGFDLIHAHNPPDFYVAIAAFYKLFGKRFVFDHHDLSPEMYYARFSGGGNRLVHRVLVFFEKWSCRLADRVIATNESYKAMEVERSGISPDKVTIVRNGPDLGRVRRVAPDPALRAMNRTIIGYIGVMGYQDGIDYLLRALRHVIDDLGRADFYCVLIGTGDAIESLKALADELQLQDYVRFTGYIPDEEMICCLSSADVFVDPDPANPFNDRSTMIKMMEYMAMGRPIVCFDLTEHRATADDAALYARPNEELDLARKIVELMGSPQLCSDLGRRGQQRLEQQLAWPHQEGSLLSAYEQLGLYASARTMAQQPAIPQMTAPQATAQRGGGVSPASVATTAGQEYVAAK